MNTFTRREAYWYARGYYDGRTEGTFSEFIDAWPDEVQLAYKQGYDTGVADYCEFDIAVDV